jgi:hypothetical protein
VAAVTRGWQRRRGLAEKKTIVWFRVNGFDSAIRGGTVRRKRREPLPFPFAIFVVRGEARGGSRPALPLQILMLNYIIIVIIIIYYLL